jgi:hypothetical protein
MRSTIAAIAVAFLAVVPGTAQMPSTDSVSLSLKAVSKALANCRDSYTRVHSGAQEPLVKPMIGTENYDRDVKSLSYAESSTFELLTYPHKLSGRALVGILSTMDDFSVGVGSTRAEILRQMALDRNPLSRLTELNVASMALSNCQQALFDAADDFGRLVLAYVGAEDEALAKAR